MKSPTLHFRRAHQSGSAILAALGILAVTSIIVGVALSQAQNRFRTSHQSARWVQAGHAAEAGAELALLSAQKASWVADGWSGAPGAVGAAAVTKTFTLSTGVPATGPITARVAVDTLTLSGSSWLRVRSTGLAELSGGTVSGNDAQDVLLRKLSLRKDRTTGATVAAPQAIRTVEILAEPLSKPRYARALLIDQQITMTGSSSIDSFDSSDPTKSTGGVYDPAKRQSNGHVGINDTGGSSNLQNSDLYGDLAYSGPAVANTANVKGTITTPFSSPMDANLAPTWTTFIATPTAITTTSTLLAGTKAAPARYKVSNLTLTGTKVVTLAPPVGVTDSYVEIWITGDFKTTGSASIKVQPGVNAIFHIAGNIDISGSALNNQTNVASNFILKCINPPTGVAQTVDITGSGTMVAVIDAPAADFRQTGSANFSGALISKTFRTTGTASIHYDEALARFGATSGAATYRVASLVEAVR